MLELNDHELLAEFARTGSETAFTTLVARHVNLVYSAALRFTGNPHQAEEITQAVFIILARKAGKLSSHIILSGWLYQAARLTAANRMKGEIRRLHREQEAYMQTSLNEPDTTTWKQIAPLLDDAMGRLAETDRDAVVLRYFENKTSAEVAAALKLTEAAAHKRVNRAVEKLRKFFTKRGVTSTAAILAGVISVNSVQAAPSMLANTTTAIALAKGATASASTLTLIKGALKFMAWIKTKTALVLGLAVVLAIGTTVTTIVLYRHFQARAVVPRASWAFAGYANPESAFKSAMWAAGKGDVQAFITSLSPDGKLFKALQGRPEDQIASKIRMESEGTTGYRIMDKKIVSATEVILTVLPEGKSHGLIQDGKFIIQRIGTDWKVCGPVKNDK